MNRKSFVSKSILGLGAAVFTNESGGSIVPQNQDFFNFLKTEDNKQPENEKYWAHFAKMFPRPSEFTQFEHGYFSHQPFRTIELHQKFEQNINTTTSEFMRVHQDHEIELARKGLAQFLDVSAEELVLTRNTTESLNLVIMGFPWNSGDEVVIGNQDYGSMVEAFQQAEKRFGIVLKVAQIPLLPKSDEEIIQAYASLVSSKTRMLHLTHTINLTGQIIPVNAIVDRCLEKNQGISVAVDAAHSTAHTIEKIGSLRADFVGGSLHKWLCTPLGMGYLVMKSKFIDKIWPLFGDVGMAKNNIRRFEHQGTRPIHSIQSIIPAIEFHDIVGYEAKINRLRYLKNLILTEVDGKNGIHCISPWKEKQRGGAIFCLQKEGLTPAEFAKILKEKFRIFTVAIDHPVVKGIRITPHFSNVIADVKTLKNALLKL